jgi:ketosteroid isomerase-like protein
MPGRTEALRLVFQKEAAMTAADRSIPSRTKMLETVREYFVRVDAGRPDTPDLFTDDIQLFFPKFGVTHGKSGFAELGKGLMGSLTAIRHDVSTFEYVVDGDTVVVEGTTIGSGQDGREWRGGETPGGRFCSVFKFRGGLIARMHIYLDPDYTSRHSDGFLWGTERSW